MRREKQFTLEKLKSSRDITPEDCQNLFDYAKVLYELEKYQLAEKYLFSLKEILVSEQHNSALVAQVLWGLLACEILN